MKDGILTISNFQSGMANSSYAGFQLIQNCEIFDSTGVVTLGQEVEDKQTTTPSGLCISEADNVYRLFDNGDFYKNNTLISTNNTGAKDLIVWNDYVWIRYSSVVDVYGPLSGTPTQMRVITGLDTLYWSKFIADVNVDGSGEALFISNGHYIYRVTSFVVGANFVVPTFTGANVLTLRTGYYAVTMAKLGSRLMIGAQKGTSYADRVNYNTALIFPWSRSSNDTYDDPIELNNNGIQAMLSDNNKLYVIAGTYGDLYITDATNYQKVRRIPFTAEREFGQSMIVYPNAISKTTDGRLLVGTSTNTDAYNGISKGQKESKHGVYEINTENGYTVCLKQNPNELTDPAQATFIGYVATSNQDIISYSYKIGSTIFTYGLKVTKFTVKPTGTIISAVYSVGTRLNRKIFQNIEFTLSKPLAEGQSISLAYRKNLSDDFTTIGIFSYTDLGAVISHNAKALIDDAEILQLKISLIQTSNVDNIYFMNARIW